MRDIVAAHFANTPAPQAPARNAPSPHNAASSLDTYNSHRKINRPRLIGDKKVYRPVRRHTLSRIDETPPQTIRPRSKSLQHSVEFASTRPVLRSRSNISADTSRSVPVCNQSQEVGMQIDSGSPQYAEPKDSDSSSYEGPASMTDIPIMVPYDPTTRSFIRPGYGFHSGDICRLNLYKYNNRPKNRKQSNLYLAFMY